MSGNRNGSVCRGHELANALYLQLAATQNDNDAVYIKETEAAVGQML